MAVLDRDKFFERIRERLGEDDSEEALSYLEDMTDTWDDLEARARREGQEDWEEKYNNLDAEWRKRYRDRFFNTPDVTVVQEEDVKEDGKVRSFETLFEEREGE